MSHSERRWNELQTRWAGGERLNAEEEQERLALAARDELRQRELAVFAELRARVEEPGAALAPELLERVLEATQARPHLRVVSESETAPTAAPRAGLRRRVALLAAAIALPGAALGVVLMQRSAAPTASAVKLGAAVPRAVAPARSELVLASGEVWTHGGQARVGQRPLLRGDRVSTGAGQACLTIDPGIDLCLGAASEVSLESLETTDVRVRVNRGTAVAQLTRREPGSAFALEAEGVSAQARGTVFAVQHAADGSGVDVIVVEGVVSVAGTRGTPVLVQAHSRVSLRGPERSVERAAVGRGEEARFWALAAARELWSKPQIGVLEIPATEPGMSAAIDEQAPLPLPLRAFVPAGKRRIAFKASSGREVVTFVDVTAGAVRELRATDLQTGDRAAEAAAPSAAALLGAARRELGLGNSRAALALYDRLRTTHPASPEARTVLVTVGKLQLDLKQPARALTSFESYLKTGGPLAPEALAGKVMALRALGRSSDERRAIELYLERHPNGFDAPLFEKRLRTLHAP